MMVVRNTKGFTLIEVVVGIALFSILSIGVISLVSFLIRGTSQQGVLLSDQDQTRKLTSQIMNELRNATYSQTGSYPLFQAGDQQIVFYSNADFDATIERIRYYVQNGNLYKGVVDPTGNPPVYDLATEKITTVQSDLANGASPVFYYYTGSYNGVTDNPLTQPVNVTQVSFIKVSIKIFNKAGLKNTNTYTITNGGAIRNLKTNLGN